MEETLMGKVNFCTSVSDSAAASGWSGSAHQATMHLRSSRASIRHLRRHAWPEWQRPPTPFPHTGGQTPEGRDPLRRAVSGCRRYRRRAPTAHRVGKGGAAEIARVRDPEKTAACANRGSDHAAGKRRPPTESRAKVDSAGCG
jgi:hypothetical protein